MTNIFAMSAPASQSAMISSHSFATSAGDIERTRSSNMCSSMYLRVSARSGGLWLRTGELVAKTNDWLATMFNPMKLLPRTLGRAISAAVFAWSTTMTALPKMKFPFHARKWSSMVSFWMLAKTMAQSRTVVSSRMRRFSHSNRVR
jgi:hypothetical protein